MYGRHSVQLSPSLQHWLHVLAGDLDYLAVVVNPPRNVYVPLYWALGEARERETCTATALDPMLSLEDSML